MNITIHAIALVSAAVAAGVAFAAADDESDGDEVDKGFARYQSIIDRQPFGPPPDNFDPSLPAGKQGGNGASDENGGKTEAEISAEEQKMLSAVRVSVLNVTPSGAVMVGFTDSSVKPPVNYYLKNGDTSTDAAKWLVKDADPASGKVTLSKDGIEVTLSIGGEAGGGTPSNAKSSSSGARNVAEKFPLRTVNSHNSHNSQRERPPLAFSKAAMEARETREEKEGRLHGLGPLARLRERRMQKDAEAAAEEKARAEREAKFEEERERDAAERAQTREALMQIQEVLQQRQHEAQKSARGGAQEQYQDE